MKTLFFLPPIMPLNEENIFAAPSYTGQWIAGRNGRTFLRDDGSEPFDQWEVIDGKYYYFDKNGVCLTDTLAPDGKSLDKNGVWTAGGFQMIHIYEEYSLSTGIRANRTTLQDTGLCRFTDRSEGEIFAVLDGGLACRRDVQSDDSLYYSFPPWPGAFFRMEKTAGPVRKCRNIYGPFAAFFSSSGSDIITCSQLERALDLCAPISIKKNRGENRHYATFSYRHCLFYIFLCTADGIFMGNSAISATADIFRL